MTEKSTSLVKPRDRNEVKERRELFKQVAVAILSSRPALPFTQDAHGTKVSDHFVESVAIITEGILNAATNFGEK